MTYHTILNAALIHKRGLELALKDSYTPMKFKDTLINKTMRFCIGQEQDSGIYYLSIPVSNHLVDYDEYYEIDKESYHRYVEEPSYAMNLVEQCRNRQMDHLLIIKPGTNRGST